jgi:hypothetical protein
MLTHNRVSHISGPVDAIAATLQPLLDDTAESAHPAQQDIATTKESRGTSDDWTARALRAESALAAIETLCRDFDVRSNYQPTYGMVTRRIRATIAAALTEET